jgi:hypothetical protein
MVSVLLCQWGVGRISGEWGNIGFYQEVCAQKSLQTPAYSITTSQSSFSHVEGLGDVGEEVEHAPPLLDVVARVGLQGLWKIKTCPARIGEDQNMSSKDWGKKKR